MAADDREARRSLRGMQLAFQLALGKRLADDQWTRTHCTRALTAAGRGVTHNPACDPGPATVRWNERARDAVKPPQQIGRPSELLYRTANPREIPLVIPGLAREIFPEIGKAIDDGYALRREAGLPTGDGLTEP